MAILSPLAPSPYYPYVLPIRSIAHLGLNQQATQTTRVTMFANKYPWEKARRLFGVVSGYGAQLPAK